MNNDLLRRILPLSAALALLLAGPGLGGAYPGVSDSLLRPKPRPAVLTVAFGSCNRQNLPQPLWPVIAQDRPDVWVWLGDNIYGDTDSMAVLRRKYQQQLDHPGYRQFRAQVPAIIGTWDDHDYGRNDAGKEYPFKQQSQQLALDFLGEPTGSPRRAQQGLYAAYEYRVGRKTVKVILLDDRYLQATFRISDQDLIALHAKAVAAGLAPNPPALRRCAALLRNQLKACVARSLYGPVAYHTVLGTRDADLQRALQAVNDSTVQLALVGK